MTNIYKLSSLLFLLFYRGGGMPKTASKPSDAHDMIQHPPQPVPAAPIQQVFLIFVHFLNLNVTKKQIFPKVLIWTLPDPIEKLFACVWRDDVCVCMNPPVCCGATYPSWRSPFQRHSIWRQSLSSGRLKRRRRQSPPSDWRYLKNRSSWLITITWRHRHCPITRADRPATRVSPRTRRPALKNSSHKSWPSCAFNRLRHLLFAPALL